MLTDLKDPVSFEAAIRDSQLSIVHFHAPWAEQCQQVNQVLEALSKQKNYSLDAKFYTCQAEEVSEISLKYNIEAVPTVVLFRAGKVIETVHGADAPKIAGTINKHIKGSSEDAHSIGGETTLLQERLKALINRSPIILFMKGDKTTPRCGFSKQIVEILNNTGMQYDTFDILKDEEVRQGLKEHSDWPTYPQLYVNGELIGGLDIVKEMHANGELSTILKGASS